MIKKLLVLTGIATVGATLYGKHVYNDLKTNAMMKLYNGEELDEIEAEFLEKHKEFRAAMKQAKESKEERKNNNKRQAEEAVRIANENLQQQMLEEIRQQTRVTEEIQQQNVQQQVQEMNNIIQQQM